MSPPPNSLTRHPLDPLDADEFRAELGYCLADACEVAAS